MSKTNPKRKNNEKRKEKSRVAARCRRNREQHIFTELTEALPVRREDVEQLDKASIMRLAIAFLRARDAIHLLPEQSSEDVLAEKMCPLKAQESYLEALDGFVFVISQLGDVIYCSDNVTEHLGLSQLELMGQSIFEFSHPCDHEELREVLRARHSAPQGRARSVATFPLRLKCTLTGKGRSVHLKSASYKVIQFTGHVVTPNEKTIEGETAAKVEKDTKKAETDSVAKGGALIAVGRSIPHPANIEIPLDSTTFLTKHSLDMKFTYIDEVLQQSLGFAEEELVGQSVYEHQHAADASALAHNYKTLFSKGQCETGRYRFLAKCGGYAWVQTQATLITDKQQRPLSVVCVNYFISGIECKDEVFSANQMRHADLKPTPQAAPVALKPVQDKPVASTELQHIYRTPKAVSASISNTALPNGAIVEEILIKEVVPAVPAAPAEEARPRPATAHIFAPRTEDMNTGYLMFSDDDPGRTMLKDEPEDLTHLAPTAGDACIPLEDSPFDMFDEFILNDNYCSILGEDLANGSPVESLGTDSLLLSSPETQESDSSCEQSSLLTELSLDGLDGGRSEGELDGRAPYIPMSGSDELPLLAPAVMWGALPVNVSLARPTPPPVASEPAMPPPAAPSLQRLLASPPHTGPPPQDIITNIYADQGLMPGGGVTTWDTGVKRCRTETEELSAKRSKRTAPVLPTEHAPTSSVLMNLLNVSRQSSLQRFHKIVNSTQSFIPPNFQGNDPPRSLANQTDQSKNTFLTLNPLSPLSVNLGSPMYTNPCSPMFHSPISPQMSPYSQMQSSISPLVYNRLAGNNISPGGALSPLTMSPNPSPRGILRSECDPFLTNKMLSPHSFQVDTGTLSERDKIGLDGAGLWDPGDLYQDTSILPFDDPGVVISIGNAE